MLGFKKAGGVGGAEPPPFANVLAFSPRKSFEKRLWSMNSSNNNTIEIIVHIKVQVKSKS